MCNVVLVELVAAGVATFLQLMSSTPLIGYKKSRSNCSSLCC
jgi:hypothetical protein